MITESGTSHKIISRGKTGADARKLVLKTGAVLRTFPAQASQETHPFLFLRILLEFARTKQQSILQRSPSAVRTRTSSYTDSLPELWNITFILFTVLTFCAMYVKSVQLLPQLEHHLSGLASVSFLLRPYARIHKSRRQRLPYFARVDR